MDVFFRSIAVIGLILTLPVAPVHAQEQEVPAVALIREDGILVPYAAYRDSTWALVERSDVQDIESSTWYFRKDAETTRVLSTGEVVEFGSGSLYRGQGLASSYEPEYEAPSYKYPGPKSGIALSWKFADTRFVSVDTSVHRSLLSEVKDSLAASIKDLTTRYPDRHGRAFARADSSSISISLRRTETKIEGIHIYHAAARREYYTKEGCGPMAKLRVWVIETEEGMHFENQEFGNSGCDGKMLPGTISPLTAFEFDERVYIAALIDPWEGVSKALYEVQGDTLEERISWY